MARTRRSGSRVRTSCAPRRTTPRTSAHWAKNVRTEVMSSRRLAVVSVTGIPPLQVGNLQETETERRPQRTPTAERGYRQRAGAEMGVGQGKAAGTQRALRASWEACFQCAKCCSLVDLRSAIRAAGGEDAVQTGDGCAGCSRLHPGRHRQKQEIRIGRALSRVRDGQHALLGQPGRYPGERVFLGTARALARLQVAIERL